MKKLQRITAAFIALLLIMTALTAFSVFAEGEGGNEEESSTVAESSSSVEEESSSSAPQEESSSSEEEKSSSSDDEKSSSSEEEESSSSEEEEQSSAESRRETRSSSESSAEETYAQTIVHEETGIAIGLSQPNEKLLIEARSVSASDSEAKDIYKKLEDASKEKGLVCCYELILGGDETFNSKVTVMLPVDENLIGRSMVVLFYPERGSHVETSNKNVNKAAAPSSAEETESEESEPGGSGVIKVSETLEAGRKYYFAVCEVADFVSGSNGLGLLEIMAILIGIMALISGGLLAFLWVRYNKKQQQGKAK